MARGNRGIIVVVALGALLGAGVFILYLTVIGPRTARKQMQAQVEAFGQKWAAARACLVGDAPRSPDGFEAMILREAASADDLRPALATCTGRLKDFERGELFDVGREVEAAWVALEKPRKGLIEAQALRTGADDANQDQEEQAARGLNLARAIAALDGAYDALRQAAGLAPVAHPGTALPRRTAIPLAGPDGKPVPAGEMIGDDNVFVMQSSTPTADVLVSQRAAGQPVVQLVADEVVRAASDTPWGLWQEPTSDAADGPTELRAGPLGPDGLASGDGAVVAPANQPLAARFALDADPLRVAILQAEDPTTGAIRLRAARSKDGGASFPERVLVGEAPDPTTFYFAADPGNRRLDVVWRDDHGSLEWFALRRDHLDAPLAAHVLAPAGPVEATCFSETRAWLVIDGQLVTAALGQAAQAIGPSPGGTLRCHGDQLLAVAFADHGRRVVECSPGGCADAATIAVSGTARVVSTIGQGGPVIASELAGLVTIWQSPAPGKAPVAGATVRLPDGYQVEDLMDWGGKPWLAATANDAVALFAP